MLPVIFFHAGFRSFGGGFVGVDVFFVISGYLITSLILAERDLGTFTLTSFYERRARRILPALFLVMLCCCPFSWFWMMPDDLRDFAQTLAAVSTFSSNILFWIKSGYFDSANELKPLLHTWTLAVEEQYYLLFPVLLLLLWRFWKGSSLYPLVALALGSLALAQWGAFAQPRAAYYLLPSRAWELLIGVFAAYHLYKFRHAESNNSNPSRTLRETFAWVGVILICAAIFTFSKDTPFPSLYTLVPTSGAALVIIFASPQTQVGYILGNRLLVGLGVVSYSAYLWHQPLLAFARIHSGSELSTGAGVLLSLVAIALAYLTYKFVESPFRRKNYLSRGHVVQIFVSLSVAFIAVGGVVNLKHGFINRLTVEQQEIYSYTKFDFSTLWRDGRCFLDPEQGYSDFSNICRETHSKLDIVLIWGDSHAAALTPGLRQLIPDVVQYTASACPPIIGVQFISRPHCKGINEFVIGEIRRLQPRRVYLHADWLAYKQQYSLESIEATIDAVRNAAPQSKITIVGGVPEWWPSLPVVLLRKHLGLDKEQFLQNPLYEDSRRMDAELRSAAAAGAASFVSAMQALCGREVCRVVIRAGNRFQPVAWDRAHLTEAGSVFLANHILAGEKSPP